MYNEFQKNISNCDGVCFAFSGIGMAKAKSGGGGFKAPASTTKSLTPSTNQQQLRHQKLMRQRQMLQKHLSLMQLQIIQRIMQAQILQIKLTLLQIQQTISNLVAVGVVL